MLLGVGPRTPEEIGFEDELWEAVRQIFALPFFSRVWTVQEVGLAAQVVYYLGDIMFTRDQLAYFQIDMRDDRKHIPLC